MTAPKQSRSISDLLKTEEKIECPYSKEVGEVCMYYIRGAYDTMTKKIESFEEGQYIFFKYLKMELDNEVPNKATAERVYKDILRIFDLKKQYEVYYDN